MGSPATSLGWLEGEAPGAVAQAMELGWLDRPGLRGVELEGDPTGGLRWGCTGSLRKEGLAELVR